MIMEFWSTRFVRIIKIMWIQTLNGNMKWFQQITWHRKLQHYLLPMIFRICLRMKPERHWQHWSRQTRLRMFLRLLRHWEYRTVWMKVLLSWWKDFQEQTICMIFRWDLMLRDSGTIKNFLKKQDVKLRQHGKNLKKFWKNWMQQEFSLFQQEDLISGLQLVWSMRMQWEQWEMMLWQKRQKVKLIIQIKDL